MTDKGQNHREDNLKNNRGKHRNLGNRAEGQKHNTGDKSKCSELQ